jgi:hypothetical protein
MGAADYSGARTTLCLAAALAFLVACNWSALRMLAVGSAAAATALGLHAIFAWGEASGATAVLYPAWLGGLYLVYRRLLPDLFMLAVGCLSAIVVATGGLASGEMYLRCRVRDGRLKFASNAFFFEEGQGPIYQDARYGEFRVDRDGDLLLTGLRGEALQSLEAPAR